MKHLKYFRLLLAAFVLNTTSCSDSYMDTVPTESVPAEIVGETLEGLYTAINGIHRKMVSTDLDNQGMGGEPGFMLSREAHGDDMTWDTQTWHRTHFTWDINTSPSSSYNYGVWKTYYQFILNANLILELLDKNFNNSTEAKAKHIKGEALCFRAWSHFQLVQYYAKRYSAGATNDQPGVPYRESSVANEMARNTVEEVYEKINKDLDNAIQLLEGFKPIDITHYTQKIAYGLKARVALVQQNYSAAAENAIKAIEIAEADGHYLMDKSELNNGFATITTSTKDALYAAKTLSDHTVYFYSFYSYMSWNFNSSSVRTGIKCISNTTYDLMSKSDLRRKWWDPTGEADVPSSSYNKRKYQNRKFTARATSDAVGDVAFMRLSELYLIAAEAYARTGDNVNAKKYFHIFVAERDPEYVDSGNTGDSLAEEIMTHRRIELWGEGFRWFDLKRLNLPCIRSGNNFDITFCGFLERKQEEIGWYYEIPKQETDFNSLAVKNY